MCGECFHAKFQLEWCTVAYTCQKTPQDAIFNILSKFWGLLYPFHIRAKFCIRVDPWCTVQCQISLLLVNTVDLPGQNHKWSILQLWRGCCTQPLADQDQIWHSSPRYRLTCQISFESVYSVAYEEQPPTFTVFSTRHSVMAPSNSVETKLKAVHNYEVQTFPCLIISKLFLKSNC